MSHATELIYSLGGKRKNRENQGHVWGLGAQANRSSDRICETERAGKNIMAGCKAFSLYKFCIFLCPYDLWFTLPTGCKTQDKMERTKDCQNFIKYHWPLSTAFYKDLNQCSNFPSSMHKHCMCSVCLTHSLVTFFFPFLRATATPGLEHWVLPIPWLTVTGTGNNQWGQEGGLAPPCREQRDMYFQRYPTDLTGPWSLVHRAEAEGVWFCLSVPPSLPGRKWLVWWVALLWTSSAGCLSLFWPAL